MMVMGHIQMVMFTSDQLGQLNLSTTNLIGFSRLNRPHIVGHALSPNREWFKEFANLDHVQMIFMPLWNLGELLDLQKCELGQLSCVGTL